MAKGRGMDAGRKHRGGRKPAISGSRGTEAGDGGPPKGPGKEALDKEKDARRRKAYGRLRRGQDVLLSGLALLALLPLLLVTAAAVYLDDPHGSPIFVQTRCGREGRLFRMYKFRSMCVGAEERQGELLESNEMDGPVFKMKNDPRITRVGRSIRRTSIDELPQLLNILKGDMSIVGPRPPLPQEAEQYSDYQRQRLSVTPGLTCYWQIQPHRYDLSFDEWVELDLRYIRERSFVLDWKIIFRTVRVILRGQGE